MTYEEALDLLALCEREDKPHWSGHCDNPDCTSRSTVWRFDGVVVASAYRYDEGTRPAAVGIFELGYPYSVVLIKWFAKLDAIELIEEDAQRRKEADEEPADRSGEPVERS